MHTATLSPIKEQDGPDRPPPRREPDNERAVRGEWPGPS